MRSQRIAGRYTLQREIGRGAGGVVWAALDEVLGRQVALKQLGAAPGLGSAAIRVEREARLAARLGHPHVVAVFDLVTEHDDNWLVMEYVDGRSLADVAREAPMTADDAARLVAPVADALAQAHALGIVHRDVKPSNLLVGPDGVKLSDFGIARGQDDATLTRTGLVTGSPAYLAPEVATGGQASAASDVWSLGATLLHLLTGRPPYHLEGQENGPLAVVHRIAYDEVPVAPTAGWLAPLMARMMAKDPSDRPTMAQVRDGLDRTVGGGQDTAVLPAVTPPPMSAAAENGREPRRVAVIAGVGAGAVLALLLIVVLAWPDSTAEPSEANPSTASATNQTQRPATPTVQEMTEFARNYVRTADADPATGFAMLTPGYQAQSSGYADFWGPMKNPKIEEISADPDAMTVTYQYSYVLKGKGRQRERVTLQLVDDGGHLLIDGSLAQ